jgi:hypothetical protein
MNSMKYMELRQSIDCGELDCLKACCAAGQLQSVAVALRGLDSAGIRLLEKMLCGCAVNPGASTTGNVCYDKIVAFAKEHTSTVNALQTALLAAGTLGIPIIDQSVGVVSLALESLEDAAQAKPGDPSTLTSLVTSFCSAITTVDEWRAKAVGLLPDSLEGIADLLLTLTSPGILLKLTCCDESVAKPQLPPPPGTPTTPISTPTTPVGACTAKNIVNYPIGKV